MKMLNNTLMRAYVFEYLLSIEGRIFDLRTNYLLLNSLQHLNETNFVVSGNKIMLN